MEYKHYLPILLFLSTFIARAEELKTTPNDRFTCETGLSIVVVTPNPMFCPGEVLELALNGSADPSQYEVYIDGGASFYNNVTPTNWSQTVQVQIIDNDFGLIAVPNDQSCPVLEQGFVMNEPTENLIVPSYDSEVYVDEIIHLTVTADYNADIVLWNSATGGTITPSGDGSSVAITFETTGSHTVTANASNECGPGPASTFDFTVSLACETTPVIVVKTPNPTFCSGEIIELELTGSYDPSRYRVIVDLGGTLVSSATNWSEQVLVQLGGSSHLNMVAERTDDFCTAIEQAFSINKIPGDIGEIPYEPVICDEPGITTAFAIDPATYGADEIQWVVSAGATVTELITDGSSVSISYSGPGDYTITATPLNVCGPSANPKQFPVTVLDDAPNNALAVFGKNGTATIASIVNTPKHLVVNSCEEILSGCGIQVNDVHLEVRFGFLDGYYTSSPFSAYVDLLVKAYGADGVLQDYGNATYRLELDEDNPETAFIDGFHDIATNIRYFEVTLTGHSIDPALVDDITLEMSYEREVTHNMDYISVGSLNSVASGWDVNFSWAVNEACASSSIKDFQLQVLKKVEGGGLPQWQEAVDIFVEGQAHYKMAMGQGSGNYLWRVRPVDNHPNGLGNKRNYRDNWADGVVTGFVHPEADNEVILTVEENDVNWIYSRTYTEGNRYSEQITYADGLQQVLQQQTRLNSMGHVVTTQTVQDHQGRNAVTSLPVPVAGSDIGYKKQLFTVDGTTTEYEADNYDNNGKATAASTINNYYSASSFADDIPDDEGYPFTRTVYTTDGTNRIKEQTGVGELHHDRTVKYYYGSVAQDELDNLFGPEAPLASNVQKTTVVDANGVSSVTYTDKAGKTIVTALTGEGNTTPGLEGLETGESDSLGAIVEIITDDQRVSQYKRLLSKQIVFPTGGTIDKINYFLQPVKFSQDDCFGEELYNLCYSCDYKITVTAYHQEGDSLDILYDSLLASEKLNCDYIADLINKPLGPQSFAAGTWVIEVNLETYTGDTDGKFVDQNWAEVETQVRAGYDAVLAGIYADLDIYDYEGAYAKLASLGADIVFTDDAQTIGYYRLNVGDVNCPEYIEVPFYEGSCGHDCSTPSEFRSYFTDYVGAKYPEIPLMDGSDLLYAPGFTAFQLDAMLNNMVIEAGTNTWQDSEGNIIGCQQLWDAWIAEARAYGELYHLTATANAEGYDVPGFLDRFIDRLGIVKTIWLPSSGTIPKSEYYKYFLFDQAIDEHCGCIQISLERTDCNISQSVFNGYPAEQRTNAFECIRALSSEPINYAAYPNDCQIPTDYYNFLLEKASEAEENIKDKIKNRYSEIQAMLHEHYENLYGTLYDSLYSACEIQSMGISVVDSLVSEVSLSVYSYMENSECVIGIGTPEEQETIKRNLLYKIDFNCTNLRVTHLEDYNFNLNVHWEVSATSNLSNYYATGKIINWNDYLFTINDDKVHRLDKNTGASISYTLPANYRVKQDRIKGETSMPQAIIDGDGNLYFVQYDYSLYSAYPYHNKPIQQEVIVKLDKDLNFITSVTKTIGTYGLIESLTGDNTYLYTIQQNIASSEYKLIRWDQSTLGSGLEIGTAPYADIIEIVNNKFLLFNDDKISYFDPSTGSMDFELLINSHYWKVINNKVYAVYQDPYDPQNILYEISLEGKILNEIAYYNPSEIMYRWDVVDDMFVFFQSSGSGANAYRISTGEMLWQTNVYDQYYYFPHDIFIEDKVLYLNHAINGTSTTSKFDLYRCSHGGFCFIQSESFPDSVAVDTIFSHNFALQSCEQVRSGHMANSISQQIEKLVDKKRQTFYEAYENTCMENIDHNLTLEYSLGYNQYTLYYYDRGGNLMKTVSPEGVKIDGSNDHDLVTRYEYNSMGQLTRQHSPDANSLAYNTANDATDESDKYFADFYYSDLGQLRYSQNAQQKVEGTYSYTRYDKLGRINEVGEAAGFDMQELRSNRNNMSFPSTGTDITKTVYSSPFIVDVAWLNNEKQENLRNRISYTHTEDNDLDNTNDTYTIYSYDPHGNVKWMVQKLPYLEKTFRIDYEYNLISGNVTQVVYNAYTGPGGNIQSEDEFRHRYTYDDDNRLKTVETSTDGHIWSAEARYEYYPHGPLKNVNLGHDPVHSSEYYYTLHGWIKGINMDRRIKGEGHVAAIYSTILNYYTGDYINTEVSTAMNTSAAYVVTNSSDLYNGNISGIEDYFSGAGDASNSGRVFKYDELNRIMNSEFDIAGFGTSTLVGTTGYTYDRNGNLQTLNRTVNSTALDALAYTYESNRNRLTAVNDAGTDANDLTNAYFYDEIGNLTSDSEKDIEWNVYGKVKAVVDKTTPTQKTEFFYDPSGNRVLKKQTNEAGFVTGTYYVRDASGNVMATYEQTGEGVERTLRLEEQPIYGSDRLGLYKSYKLMTFLGIVGEEPEAGWQIAAQDLVLNQFDNTSYLLEDGVTLTLGPGFTVDATAGETFEARPRIYEEKTLTNEEPRPMAHEEVHHRVLGFKQYELKDHLGNVRAVISDRRTLEQGLDINNNTVTYYKGELMNYNHYYPFGMDMASWTSDNFDSYRYGFNGKEKDDKGEFGSQTTYDYGFRIYNPGIAKFLSVDPLSIKYPFYSPYQYAGNKPIKFVDVDGLEEGVDVRNRIMETGYLKGKVSKEELQQHYEAQFIGAVMGIGVVLTQGAIIRYSPQLLNLATRLGLYSAPVTLAAGKYGPDAVGFAAGALGYDGEIPGVTGDELGKLINKGLRKGAASFYGRFSKYAERGIKYVDSHLDGINFNKDVKTRILEKGTKLYQWTNEGNVTGDYFSTSADATNIGVPQIDGVPAYWDDVSGTLKKKTLVEVTLTESVEVLESTADDIDSWIPQINGKFKGGDIQIFSPEIKEKTD